jgi:hypothetical protein
MEHKKSTFYFESNGVEWRVEYFYIKSSIAATVYEDGNIYHEFGSSLPRTRTEHPTKSQAKEIITAAKKLNKERDKRDSKIKKLLN